MASIKINNENIITISQEAFEDLLKQFNVDYYAEENTIEFKTPFEEKTMNTEEVEIELTDDEFLKLAKMAHERDITFNKLCNEILQEHINRLDTKVEKDFE